MKTIHNLRIIKKLGCTPILCITTLLFFHSNCIYAKISPIFVSLDISQIYSSPGKTQKITLFNNLGNTYIGTNNWESDLSFVVGVGAKVYKHKDFTVNTSLRYLPTNNILVDGQIWQFNNPLFDDLAYSMRVRSNILLFESAWSWTHYAFQPSLILGLGRAVNIASYYMEYQLIDTASPPLKTFTGANTVQIAYEVGFGFDYPIKNTVIEFAYRFIDSGVARLGLSPLQNTKEHFSTGHIQYHTINLGVRYYYDYAA
ncbi:MAG: hypothetical protein P1U74_08855 [Legionellaceae bacterium]|nr:hypothetical protein [Legionellaceae bacterium]